MFTLTINGKRHLGMSDAKTIVAYLSKYDHNGMIKSESWGEISTESFVQKATAGSVGSGGREEVVYNGMLCNTGADLGVVKFG